ncbi:MAG TPA: tyrosine-type recombinase/integrase [Candidatus Sulfotelmatobacter sp.]|nr:tyrosine-type recombinase/integrase [Candidatus Sulfotelmatobacter sp.]
MKANVAISNGSGSQIKRRNHALTFAKVLDGRKQPIRGLWLRGSRYYARLSVENPITGVKATRRVPLVDRDNNPVQTAAQAVAELKRLQTKRSDNTLPVLTRTPKFADYVAHYLDFISSGHGAKKSGTVEKEKTILNRWIEFIGGLRLDQIKPVHVNRFVELRLKEKKSPRTINLDVIGLRVVLKRAISDGFIQRLPTEGIRPLKTSTEKRTLFSSADLDALCKAAFETKKNKRDEDVPVTENGQEFVDYVRLMAYCGARRNEALGLRWDDVDFGNAQLFIRRQITSRGIEELKNRDARVVDFNPKLKTHLSAMKSRSHNVSQWLFPSPQRGEKDIPAKSFRESLTLVRDRAKLTAFGFHDCRHHFISMCVMSGIDFMTIAAWVGHKDGGVLIGKVYGHLANEHRKAMAERLNFEPAMAQNGVKH